MAVLENKTQNKVLLNHLRIADRTWARAVGLLGTAQLHEQEGLWIHPCNSIHTFFMKYPIDCVFLDSKMKIKKIVPNVNPGKIVWPCWGAKSVVEMKSGTAKKYELKIGDQLHVGH